MRRGGIQALCDQGKSEPTSLQGISLGQGLAVLIKAGRKLFHKWANRLKNIARLAFHVLDFDGFRT